jgi:hypothetical protein
MPLTKPHIAGNASEYLRLLALGIELGERGENLYSNYLLY